MPIDAAGARNQFLATMATIVQKGGISGPQAMEAVAESTAAEISKANPGIASDALLATLPDAWKTDPQGSTTRRQMNAFLEVAGPVLGVDRGVVSPLATRGVAAGRDVDAAILINKARQAAALPSPLLDAAVDLRTTPLVEVRDSLRAAFSDAAFIDSLGGPRMGHLLRELAIEFVGALDYSQPGPPNESAVMAGGVEVVGPNVRKAAQERAFGTFRTLPLQTTVGELARAVAHVAAIRSGLDEIELRSAMAGKPVDFMSGHAPPQDALPLHVALTPDGKELRVGLGLEMSELRGFHDNPSADDLAVVKSVGGALRAEDAEMAKFLDADMPVGFFLDARVQKTETVRAALGATSDAVGA